MVSPPLLTRTPALLDWGSTLVASLNRYHLLTVPVSEQSHVGSGLQHLNFGGCKHSVEGYYLRQQILSLLELPVLLWVSDLGLSVP